MGPRYRRGGQGVSMPWFARHSPSRKLLKNIASNLELHLDNKNRMVGMTTCSIGSMTTSLVHPRDVFRLPLPI